MTTYVADHDSGRPLCPDCGVGACISTPYECRDEHCRCGCGIDETGVHRNDSDGRPPDVLAAVANGLDRERYDVTALVAERFGGGRRA